jgi:hypothetical protein
MINEHDIKDLIDKVYDRMPEQPTVELNTTDDGHLALDIRKHMELYTETLCKLMAEQCDKAWYYDAANLIRKMTGIPVSIVAPCSAHAKDSYEEGL